MMKNFYVILGVVAVFSTPLVRGFAGTPCSSTENGFVVDPSDCNIYYQCSNGVYTLLHCPTGLNFNARGSYCDWPSNAPCEEQAEEVVQPDPVVVPLPTTTSVPKVPTTTTTTTKAPAPVQTTAKPTTTTTQAPPPQNALITQSEFLSAASTKGGHPGPSYYTGFIASLPKAGITTRREAILFLAHATWETVGFIYTKEVYCQTNLADCLRAYPNNAGGLPGKVYYGRGMMQLTWDYNYKAASTYLYGDDRLIQNPDVVGTDPEIGWATAAWYWYANVHDRSHSFGSTLKAINGALECEGGSHGGNRYLRFLHYKDILARLGSPLPSDDDGWCTAW